MKTYRAPLETPMVVDRSLDAPRDTLEPPEGTDDDEHADSEDDLFCAGSETARGEHEVIEEMREHQDGEVERWELRAKA